MTENLIGQCKTHEFCPGEIRIHPEIRGRIALEGVHNEWGFAFSASWIVVELSFAERSLLLWRWRTSAYVRCVFEFSKS
jgi:hypothetical protein